MTSNAKHDHEHFIPIRPEITNGVFGRTFCTGPIRITLTRINPGGGFTPHRDSYGHLFIFLSGCGELTIGSETQRVEPGMIFTIPAGTKHAIDNNNDNNQNQELLLLSCNLPPDNPLNVPLNNLLTDILDDLIEEHFDPLYTTENFLLERIVSHGHTTAPNTWYDQDRHEWVCLLSGSARLTFPDAEPQTLHPGEYFSLPAGLRHRVDWTDPEVDSVWLALHYTPDKD